MSVFWAYAGISAILLVLWRSPWKAKRRPLVTVTAGVLVALASHFLVLASAWDSVGPRTSEFLKDMAPELVGSFLAVVVIERFLAWHEEAEAEALLSKIEVTLRTQVIGLQSLILRGTRVSELNEVTLWVFDRLDRRLSELEDTVARTAPLRPSYGGHVEALVKAGGFWRERLWDAHEFVSAKAKLEERLTSLQALNMAGDELNNAAGDLLSRVSSAPVKRVLGRILQAVVPGRQ